MNSMEESAMWKSFNNRLFNLISKLIAKLSRHETKEMWSLLEARRSINLDNLEYLKKLRISKY
jgi:hypothetical protein